MVRETKRFSLRSLAVIGLTTLLVAFTSSNLALALTNFSGYQPDSARNEARAWFSYHALKQCYNGANNFASNSNLVLSTHDLATFINRNTDNGGNMHISWQDQNTPVKCDNAEINRLFNYLDPSFKVEDKINRSNPVVFVRENDKCKEHDKSTVTDDCLVIADAEYTNFLNSELSKYKKYDNARSISQPAWYAIWKEALNQCMDGDFSEQKNGNNNNNQWYLSYKKNGKTIHLIADKNKTGIDNKTVFWAPNDSIRSDENAMTCGQVFDGVRNNLQAYMDAQPASTEDKDNNVPPGSNDTSSDNSTGDDETCRKQAEGFGWVMCPGATLLSTITSPLATAIDHALRFTILADRSDDLVKIWQRFLNVANVGFAIVFLIMIYSMATGSAFMAMSNYSIKKILPRVVVVAVAVNTSFYICAALADLANIAGIGIYHMTLSAMSADEAGGLIGDVWSTVGNLITSSVIASIGIFVLMFFFFGTFLIAAIVTLLMIVARNVILMTLVIISPIAVVLYLLPNTERWAKKWLDTYVKTLLVYPMFMAVLAVSKLIPNILSIGPPNPSDLLTFFVPTVCAVIPFVSIIPIIKMAGGIMATVAGNIQKAADRTKIAKGVNNMVRRSSPVRGISNKIMDTQRNWAGRDRGIRRFIGRTAGNNETFMNMATAGAEAASAHESALQKSLAYTMEGKTDQEKLAIGKDERQTLQTRSVALSSVNPEALKAADAKELANLSAKLQPGKDGTQIAVQKFRDTTANLISKGDDGFYSNKANVNAVRSGKLLTDLEIAVSLASMSPKKMADASPATLGKITGALANGAAAGNAEAMNSLTQMAGTANAVKTNPRLYNDLSSASKNALNRTINTNHIVGSTIDYSKIGRGGTVLTQRIASTMKLTDEYNKAIASGDAKGAEKAYAQMKNISSYVSDGEAETAGGKAIKNITSQMEKSYTTGPGQQGSAFQRNDGGNVVDKNANNQFKVAPIGDDVSSAYLGKKSEVSSVSNSSRNPAFNNDSQNKQVLSDRIGQMQSSGLYQDTSDLLADAQKNVTGSTQSTGQEFVYESPARSFQYSPSSAPKPTSAAPQPTQTTYDWSSGRIYNPENRTYSYDPTTGNNPATIDNAITSGGVVMQDSGLILPRTNNADKSKNGNK